MCGRFTSTSTPEELAEHFEVDEIRTDPLPQRWNVAPTLDVYTVIERRGSRRLGTMRWGFVPPWTKTLKGAGASINARLEDLAGSRMFRTSFEKRRCLLPADGFYEWQASSTEGGDKQPYHLHAADGAPFAFAGVWTVWRDPDAEPDDDGEVPPLFSTAIVTTAAEGELARIHERVPLIVPQRLWSDWLTADAADAPHLEAAMRALGPPSLVAEAITTRVNDVRNEGPELLEPAA